MATQPESRIVSRIIAALNALPSTLVWKIHGGPFQAAGIPDIVGLHSGRFVGIEVKVPGGKATKLQELTLARIEAAGGIAGIATSVDEALALIGVHR